MSIGTAKSIESFSIRTSFAPPLLLFHYYYYLLLLYSATISTTASAQEDNGALDCFPLKGSTTCPAFQTFYISVEGNQKRYPFLANVTDIASFDEALTQYVQSSDFYLSALGCNYKANPTTNIPYARYSFTYMCATLIQDTTTSLPCNYQYNLSPPALCQRTCFDYVASVNQLTDNNIDMCPNQFEQSEQVLNLNTTCQYWSGLNGTHNCIVGLANEPNYCGFGGLNAACQYCKTNSTQDACCQQLVGCRTLSVGAIIGIIIGSLVFVGVVGFFAIWMYKRRKRQRNGGNNHFNRHRSGPGKHRSFSLKKKKRDFNPMMEDDDTTSLGYESLVTHSQRGLVASNVNPTTHIQQQQQQQQQLLQVQQQQPQTMINGTMTMNMEEFFEVKHPYPPQMGDELALHIGDIVCVAMNFDDGWALGFNVTTGLKGVFPLVCVVPVNKELLEQLLNIANSSNQGLPPPPQPPPHQLLLSPTASPLPTNKTLIEEGSPEYVQMQQLLSRRSTATSTRGTDFINESHESRRVASEQSTPITQHESIPRRTASIMRSYVDYGHHYEDDVLDSPTSPNLNTPFFVDVPISQPEPILQPHHPQHPIVETIELHQQKYRSP